MVKMKSHVSMIAAIDSKRGIGKKNELAWHCPADMRFFKEHTYGKVVVMGRKTLESIGGPLPGRKNIVVSSNPSLPYRNIAVAADIQSALKGADIAAQKNDVKEVVIIGGGEIYRQCLSIAKEVLLTRFPMDIDADAHFPELPDNLKLFSGGDRHELVKVDGEEYVLPVSFERWHVEGL